MNIQIVVGLGFGDEGKGSSVDYLCRESKSSKKLVVRYNGGHQAGHNVVLPDGTHHCFSQIGSGAFAGASTFLASNMIIDPLALVNELEKIKSSTKDNDVNTNIFVDGNCLVTTYLHIAMNRLEESLNKHGSCGVGVGKTRQYWLEHGQDAINAEDLDRALMTNYGMNILIDKLSLLRQRYLLDIRKRRGSNKKYADYIYDTNVAILASKLVDAYNGTVSHTIKSKADLDMLNGISFTDNSDLDIIFEGAQGVLLDENHGFHPHTTWSTTTTLHAEEEIVKYFPEGIRNVNKIGVIRTYHTRHGNGPFPTFVDCEIPESEHNKNNEWQNDFKIGDFDGVLFKYALEKCPVDSLFVTCLDHIDDKENMKYIDTYYFDSNVFGPPSNVTNINQFLDEHGVVTRYPGQQKIEDDLTQPLSEYSHEKFPKLIKSDKVDEVFPQFTNIPVKYKSYGPTYKDKVTL